MRSWRRNKQSNATGNATTTPNGHEARNSMQTVGQGVSNCSSDEQTTTSGTNGETAAGVFSIYTTSSSRHRARWRMAIEKEKDGRWF